MCSILDIDLDYFPLFDDPVEQLGRILHWANRPVDAIFEEHHQALPQWKQLLRRKRLGNPKHILHVDEHHDMMNSKSKPNIANVIYHAMKSWDECRVHWLIQEPIDDPSVWLDEEEWTPLSRRFSFGGEIPQNWSPPDIVTVCTSPQFVEAGVLRQLIAAVKKHDASWGGSQRKEEK